MAKTVEIECAAYSVKADWYEGKGEDRILLALIGWASNRNSYADILTTITEQTGMSALVFDYSGHGDSPFDINKTTPAQHFLEVIYVFDWLKEHYPSVKICVMGSSYGGFHAAHLTQYREFDNLILRAPAINPPSDFYTLNGTQHSEESWAAKNAYRNDEQALAVHPLLARASSYKGKALVVVHGDDDVVPKPVTDAYIKTFNADVYIAEGFPHSIHTMPQEQIAEYQTKIADWLNS
jgi:pimeloyl-ACP methyl ester carboxylesterase